MPHLLKTELDSHFLLSAFFANNPANLQEGLVMARKTAKENRSSVDVISSYESDTSLSLTDGKGNTHPEQKANRSGTYSSADEAYRYRS